MQGNRTTPSYVAFTDTERLIGDAAKNQVAMNPNNTIFDAKRLIGRKFTDATVQSDMKLWPFKVCSRGPPPNTCHRENSTDSTFECCSSVVEVVESIECCRILSNFVELFTDIGQMLSNVVECCRILSNFVEFCRMLSNSLKFCRVIPNVEFC